MDGSWRTNDDRSMISLSKTPMEWHRRPLQKKSILRRRSLGVLVHWRRLSMDGTATGSSVQVYGPLFPGGEIIAAVDY